MYPFGLIDTQTVTITGETGAFSPLMEAHSIAGLNGVVLPELNAMDIEVLGGAARITIHVEGDNIEIAIVEEGRKIAIRVESLDNIGIFPVGETKIRYMVGFASGTEDSSVITYLN